MNLEEKNKKIIAERTKFGPYLTIYHKNFISRKPKSTRPCLGLQEFQDPVAEGFKTFLEPDDEVKVKDPFETCDDYLEKVKTRKPKVAQIYFEQPIDKLTVKGEVLLNGKSVYQVDYCDIEAEIRRKLQEKNKEKYSLPEGWEIPLTTTRYDHRPPLLLSKHAMDKPLVIKTANNLGQNDKINKILNVQTGDSEYNQVIGKLGDFIVHEQMHGKIIHPECGCLQHRNKKEMKKKI